MDIKEMTSNHKVDLVKFRRLLDNELSAIKEAASGLGPEGFNKIMKETDIEVNPDTFSVEKYQGSLTAQDIYVLEKVFKGE